MGPLSYLTDQIPFLCQFDDQKKLGQERLERAREVEVAQHITATKGASPAPCECLKLL